MFPAGTTIPEIEAEVREDAQELYKAIAGTISPPAVYLLGAVLHTAFLRLFDRIVVESTEVERLRKTIMDSRGPVVFVPTHRSYMVGPIHLTLSTSLTQRFLAGKKKLTRE